MGTIGDCWSIFDCMVTLWTLHGRLSSLTMLHGRNLAGWAVTKEHEGAYCLTRFHTPPKRITRSLQGRFSPAGVLTIIISYSLALSSLYLRDYLSRYHVRVYVIRGAARLP